MFREVATFGRPERIQTGLDFSNNTWRAARGLLSGSNIYAPTHALIPGIGPGWPVSQHVPASLLWQAPFAALPLPAALFAYTFASILAIWAGVFLLTRPRGPASVFLATGAGGFAICVGGGPETLLLGQPTGFMLLGLAMLIRTTRWPWLAGLGFMLAGSTFQTGVPLGLALLVLGCWPVVWRGVMLVLACSIPVVSLEIVNAGVSGFARDFVSGSGVHLVRLSDRIDLGGLLHRLGVSSLAVQVGAGLVVAALLLAFLAWLPPRLRRIENPPVLSLVIACTLLCTYHQPYDMLLVGGAVAPAILLLDRSRAMLPAFGLAGISAVLSTYTLGLTVDPIAVMGLGLVSALTLWRQAAREQEAASVSKPAERETVNRPAAKEGTVPDEFRPVHGVIGQ